MKTLPKTLTDDELAALLNAANGRYPNATKNLCMIRLMCYAGLRSCEIRKLKISDVNMTTCEVSIHHSKNGRSRRLWISTELRDLIGKWLNVREDIDSPWLFCTRTGLQLQRSSLQNTVATYARKAGIERTVSPHALRHTFATRLYRKTKNIRMVQRALGHADLSTTMVYTHIVDDDLQAAMVRLHA